MKQLLSSLFSALAMVLDTIFTLIKIIFTLGQAGQHVANVVKNSGEHFEMTELLSNQNEMEELRKKFKAKADK
ncbi:TPA: hypothetical protein P0E13_005063 [Vibrio harveyi]|nr:hypothetical protein [Vibrio harveyi]